MKIPVTITRTEHIDAEVLPWQALDAIKQAVFTRFNQELASLKLSVTRELNMPAGGFHEYYLDGKGQVIGYHCEGRSPRETETRAVIHWGSAQKATLLRALDSLDTLAKFLA